MITSEVTYLGDLRCKCTHMNSGSEIITDAPIDNKGKGEAFSPTDLIATAYASCMMTIIGIYCNEHNHIFKHGKAKVQKIMDSNPRRIGKIIIEMDLSNNGWSEETCNKIIHVAKACPVAKSVHDQIEITFEYQF